MKLNQIADQIWSIDNFLNAKECLELINLSEGEGYEAAKINLRGRQVLMPSVRNNERVLHFDSTLAFRFWQRLKEHIRPIGNSSPIGLNELWRFYRYHPGQIFKKHRDGSYIRNSKEASYLTFMIYLNDEFEGGQTDFSGLIVRPQTGMALIFNHSLLHEGTTVTEGVKYVLRSDIMFRLNDE